MLEARQRELLGDAIATDDRPAFQHQAAVAGLRQIGRGDQAVVASARNDDIKAIGHRDAPLLSSACPALCRACEDFTNGYPGPGPNSDALIRHVGSLIIALLRLPAD